MRFIYLRVGLDLLLVWLFISMPLQQLLTLRLTISRPVWNCVKVEAEQGWIMQEWAERHDAEHLSGLTLRDSMVSSIGVTASASIQSAVVSSWEAQYPPLHVCSRQRQQHFGARMATECYHTRHLDDLSELYHYHRTVRLAVYTSEYSPAT